MRFTSLLTICLLLTFTAQAAEKMNVLFIPVDDLNHWVGYTGRNTQTKTPNIDRLSAMGMSFTNAHCAASACEPSRAAIFSGLRPYTSGCYLNGYTWRRHVKEGTTLNATFKKAGFKVMGTGKNYHGNNPASVYLSEWDEYHTINGIKTEKYEAYFSPLVSDLKDEDLPDWDSVDYCVEKLSQSSEQPFFLSCGLIKPHLGWVVPKKYYDLFPVEDIKLPPHRLDDFDDIPEAGKKTGSRHDHARLLKTDRWKKTIQSYLATVAYTDVCVGRLLDALENGPHKDNTVVVLWGDHGWHLGEKQRWRKFTLWEEATRVPYIWYVPGMTKAGSLCDQPVDLLSLFPTLCQLGGIKKPDYLEGADITPLLKDANTPWDQPAITSHGYKNDAVRTKDWRLIRYRDGSKELYDHRKDEYEWTNLAGNPEYADVIKKLEAMLPVEYAENLGVDKAALKKKKAKQAKDVKEAQASKNVNKKKKKRS